MAEPLEECGLTAHEMNSFLYATYYAATDLPEGRAMTFVSNSSSRSEANQSAILSKHSSRVDVLKKDWLRFITFCRLCLLQLVNVDRRT